MPRIKNKKFIPAEIYKKIVGYLPICCADAVVKNNNRFLLIKRNYIPLKNQWWFAGGRLLMWESPVAAVRRRMQEELGVSKIMSIKFLGIGENRYFKKGYFNLPSHTINLAFLAEISDSQAKKIRPDSGHSAFRWFERIPAKSHPYIKKFLQLSGFKQI